VADWPEADRTAWAIAMATAGPLDPPGPAATLATATRRSCVGIYGIWLAWLQRQPDWNPAEAPAGRITRERITRFILERREAVSPTTLFANMAMFTMMVNVMLPGPDWSWIRKHPALPRQAERLAARRPISPPDAGDALRRLLGAMAAVEAEPASRDQAQRHRDLLIVAVGLATGLRPRNQRGLDLGSSIRRLSHGWEIVIRAGGTKTGQAIARRVPEWLTASLDRYVELGRPLLLAGRSDDPALWISTRGRRISEQQFHTLYRRVGGSVLGEPMRPHLVRHALASTLIGADPRHTGLASAALGHQDADMVSRHYAMAGPQAAERTWHAVRDRHRSEGRGDAGRDDILPATPAPRRRGEGDRPMTRAVIYARYSSDAQREASIEDQVRVCRARAEREGWEVVDVFADYAMSGASVDRPRYRDLFRALRGGGFGVVLTESLDRLSRDQEHLARFHKEAKYARVRIVTVAEGEIGELHVGLKGTMGAIYLQDLAQKTHRGIEGRVRQGASGGGVSFGYRVRRGLRADGTPVTGEVEIVPEEAEIVRRVFRDYANGLSPRRIARELNGAGIPGPRGGKWTASLLLGNAARATGLLRNALYAGERIWNRQKFEKDPATGKRIARPNPREAWITTLVPQLAIVDPETWATAQRRLETARRTVLESPDAETGAACPNRGRRLAAARRPPWLLSGLVRCGLCNGPLTVMGAEGRLGCANHVERGTCTNRRTVRRAEVERRVLVGLKHRLLVPELVEEFVRTYVAEVNAANRERSARLASLEAQHAKTSQQMRRLLELLKDGHGGAAMAAELRELEGKQERLAAEIAAASMPEPVPDLHPNLPEVYRRRVEALEQALLDPATEAAAMEALRSLVDAVVFVPGERRGEFALELRGDLAAFLHAAERGGAGGGPNGKSAAALVGCGRSGFDRGVMATLDAGTRKHLDLLTVG
jgi:DNA invertase Pin-like site-specific DNA recombinase/integrase